MARLITTISLLIFLIVNIGTTHGQQVYVDSLKRELSKKTLADSSRLNTLGYLASAYEEQKPDSAIYYDEQTIIWANKHHDTNTLVSARAGIGVALYIKGDYLESLNIELLCLRYYVANKQVIEQANTCNMIGNIYKGQENYPRALYYYRRCLKLATTSKDDRDIEYATFNLATVFELTNVLDSALLYIKKAVIYEYADHNRFNSFILDVWGDIYVKLKEYKKGLSLLLQSAALSKQKKNLRAYAIASVSLSKYYKRIKNQDSSIYWAKEGFNGGKLVSAKLIIYQSADLLWSAYDDKHQIDSAFKYLKLSMLTKDAIYSTAKFQAIDALNAEEDKRIAEIANARATYQNNLKLYLLLFVIVIVLVVSFLLWRNSRIRQKALNLVKEQKKQTDIQKDAAEQALYLLKETQTQLIQSEKLASLGELTAGIAHEIQNPLNFVNNFSEVSMELFDEMEIGFKNDDKQEILEIAADIRQNLEKILHHGRRADGIVKGMLQHSRASSNVKEQADINKLADEYLRLAYHGLRAKDKTFNAELKTYFGTGIPLIKMVPQDIGRVLLNLFNNAFYAVQQRQKTAGDDYKPEVTLTTSTENNNLLITVKDNGNGIPDTIRDKILQPFFTTKPTGEGTGLGLSLSYDIVVKEHGGQIRVDSIENRYTEFTILIPIQS